LEPLLIHIGKLSWISSIQLIQLIPLKDLKALMLKSNLDPA